MQRTRRLIPLDRAVVWGGSLIHFLFSVMTILAGWNFLHHITAQLVVITAITLFWLWQCFVRMPMVTTPPKWLVVLSVVYIVPLVFMVNRAIYHPTTFWLF